MKKTAVGCVVLSLCFVCFPASSQERFKGKGKFSKGKAQPAAPEAYSGPKWEYLILSRPEVAKRGGDDLRAALNKLGAEGWELVAPEQADGALYFKRPLQSARAASAAAPQAPPDAKEITYRIALKHANASDVAQILTQIFRQRGLRLATDSRTNSIILAGTEEQMLDPVKLVQELDSEEARPVEKRKESLSPPKETNPSK